MGGVFVNVDEEISKNPKKKEFTYNLKNQPMALVDYTTDLIGSFGLKSLDGSTLVLEVSTNESKDYSFKFTNVSNSTEFMIEENSITQYAGGLE